MDRIDKVFYINLDERTDRRAEIENELVNVLHYDKAERLAGLKLPHLGIYGCTMSHITLMRRMIKEGWDTMMVFEDDAQILTSRESIDEHINVFLADPQLDILCIGNSCGINEHYNDCLNRCFNTQTTSCYVLKKQFVEILMKSYFTKEEDLYTLTGYEEDLGLRLGWIDVSWTELQKTNYFMMPKIRQLKQRASFSNIINRFADYNL